MGGTKQLDVTLHADEIEEVLKWNALYKNFFADPRVYLKTQKRPKKC